MIQPMRSLPKLTITCALLLWIPMHANGQQSPNEVAKHGEEVFAKECASCHGDVGSGGSAPRLSGRAFNAQYIDRVITYGVSGTAMAPWGQRIITQDLNAVIAYVKALNEMASFSQPTSAPVLSGEAARGRDLFGDVTQELGSCSNCHAVDGKGVNIAPISKNVPADASSLRNLVVQQVKTVTVNGETFPALVVLQLREETKLYDLTTVPPALRTFPPAAVKVKDGSNWQHSSVIGSYSDKELDSILLFLRAMVRP